MGKTAGAWVWGLMRSVGVVWGESTVCPILKLTADRGTAHHSSRPAEREAQPIAVQLTTAAGLQSERRSRSRYSSPHLCPILKLTADRSLCSWKISSFRLVESC
jgi:hypothetical protein